MDQYTWNHGPLSRELAEYLLKGSSDGVYLVRESVSYPGDYTLSVNYQDKVEHYRINCIKASENQKESVFIDNGRIFDQITDLVYYYTHTQDNGLVTKLRTCLPKASPGDSNSKCSLHPQKSQSCTQCCSQDSDDQMECETSFVIKRNSCYLRPPYPLPSEIIESTSCRSSTSYENSDVEDLEENGRVNTANMTHDTGHDIIRTE